MTTSQTLAASSIALATAAIIAAGLWPSSPDHCRQVELAIAQDGGTVYALATVRGPAQDGGDQPADLGAVAVLASHEVACPPDAEPMSIAVEPVPWPCGCRRVADTAGACEADLGEGYTAAPMGRYLPAGSYRGDCARTPCVELAGVPSFNAECLPPVE